MKHIFKGIIILVVAMLAPQVTSAQGTITYVSNLGQTSTSSDAVGSDSWWAAGFFTGTNPSGYSLNSMQLGMVDASGNPSGFAVMLYSATLINPNHPGNYSPVSNLGTLNGSLSPTTSGIYVYTPTANLTLLPNTGYFIVLTAATAMANGVFDWSTTSTLSFVGGPPGGIPNRGWQAPLGFAGVDIYQSSDGSQWNLRATAYGVPQFAINATAVPEPRSEILFGLGALFYLALFPVVTRLCAQR
jgi:hypothetical protein